MTTVLKGRPPKSKVYLPADSIRFKGFFYVLANMLVSRANSKFSIVNKDGLPNLKNLLEELAMRGDPSQDGISECSLRKWFSGEDRPDKNNSLRVENICPGAQALLTADIELNPLNRFLCAIDLWASNVCNPNISLKSHASHITIISAINVIENRWAPISSLDEGIENRDLIIPLLEIPVQLKVTSKVYDSANPLTLLSFMLTIPQYIDELSERLFYDWTLDLAALTLLVRCHIASMPKRIQRSTGNYAGYSYLLYMIFFIEHKHWQSEDKISIDLMTYTEIKDPIRLAQWLMKSNNLFKSELARIGTSPRHIVDIFNKHQDRDSSEISESIYNKDRQKSERLSPEKYEYIFKYVKGKYLVMVQPHGVKDARPLPPRRDLHNNSPGEFAWGYSGSGPRFLTKSILAHHFGHDKFKIWETDILLKKFIGSLLCPPVNATFFLSSDAIETILK